MIMPDSGLDTHLPGAGSSVPMVPKPQMMRSSGRYFARRSSLPRPFWRLTSTVSGPMQGSTVGMTASVWVAFTMRMTMSMTPMVSAVGAVWNPVSTSSPAGDTKVSPSSAILSMWAWYRSTKYISAPPFLR